MHQAKTKNPNRVLAGKIAKARGEQFETLLTHSAESKGFRTIRIPDGCKQLFRRIIRIKSPFDFVFVRGKQVLFCDAKYVTGKTFTYSMVNFDQVQNLRLLESQGHPSGYIINFNHELESIVCFASARQLFALRKGDSLSMHSLVRLGSFHSFDLGVIFDT